MSCVAGAAAVRRRVSGSPHRDGPAVRQTADHYRVVQRRGPWSRSRIAAPPRAADGTGLRPTPVHSRSPGRDARTASHGAGGSLNCYDMPNRVRALFPSQRFAADPVAASHRSSVACWIGRAKAPVTPGPLRDRGSPPARLRIWSGDVLSWVPSCAGDTVITDDHTLTVLRWLGSAILLTRYDAPRGAFSIHGGRGPHLLSQDLASPCVEGLASYGRKPEMSRARLAREDLRSGSGRRNARP